MDAMIQAQEDANAANERRYQQGMAIYDEIINRYSPGGSFGEASLSQLMGQKKRDIGKETQSLISSGLYGTTTTTGLPTKWEAEVGAPSRLRLEDIQMERLSQAQLGKAGFIERREDVGPSYSDLINWSAQSQGPGQTGTYSGGGGSSSELGITFGIGSDWSKGSSSSTRKGTGSLGGSSSSSYQSNIGGPQSSTNPLGKKYQPYPKEESEYVPTQGDYMTVSEGAGGDIKNPNEGYWLNFITGKKSSGRNKPTGSSQAGWQWIGG